LCVFGLLCSSMFEDEREQASRPRKIAHMYPKEAYNLPAPERAIPPTITDLSTAQKKGSRTAIANLSTHHACNNELYILFIRQKFEKTTRTPK
jgi:hypothetical protein